MAKIGFIGLGNMGGPMAANLIKAGHDLTVFDVVASHIETLVSQGAKTAAQVTDVVVNVDFIISMLPNGKIVEDLYIDHDQLLKHIDPQTLVIDCSTIAPENAQRVFKQAKKLDINMIDAPVSGGTAAAQAGSLTFICGGKAECVERAKSILSTMGKNVFHAGNSGAGQVAKICNNMLLAIHMAGTAEALQLAVDNGLDPKKVSEIMLKSSGKNWSLEVYNPFPDVMESVPSSNDYQGGFMVDLMNKDLGLAMDVALSSKSSTPMGSLAKNLYNLHAGQGNGKLDFSSIQRLFQNKD